MHFDLHRNKAQRHAFKKSDILNIRRQQHENTPELGCMEHGCESLSGLCTKLLMSLGDPMYPALDSRLSLFRMWVVDSAVTCR